MPSYLQTIARRAKIHLPMLMPPRSPLSRTEFPLISEPPNEPMPVQPSDPLGATAISTEQHPPTISRREMPSLLPQPPMGAIGSPALSQVPLKVELPNEFKAAPSSSETRSISSVALPSKQHSTHLNPQDAAPNVTPEAQPIRSLDRSVQIHDAPTSSLSQPRSYLQTAARLLTPETLPTLPIVSSAETSVPKASDASKVSESVVTLQPPRNNSGSRSTRAESQNINLLARSDLPPSRSQTTNSPANTVHIGTIDIHIAPPPSPPIQPVATAPKLSSPLARGLTSAFGLRQG